jgi:hypothetical protein
MREYIQVSEPTQVREYWRSSQQEAWEAFRDDAAEGAPFGWEPIDHQWNPIGLRVTYRASAPAPHPRPLWSHSQLSVQDDQYAFIDRALESTDRMVVKLALQQVRVQKGEFLRIRTEASETIKAIRSYDPKRIARRGSKQRRARSNGSPVQAYEAALQDANRNAMAGALRQSIEQEEHAHALIQAADHVVVQLQDRLREIGPG